ncbi:MAG: DNA topoisomerase I [Thermoplasmatota archaeon]
MRTLIISEKDIAAKRIAEILSDGDADASKMGGVNVYDWKAKGDVFTVVGLRGHIISLDYERKYRRWSLETLPLLARATAIKTIDKDAKPIADALKKIAKNADKIIVATDFDREGELIGVEAISVVTGETKDAAPAKRKTKKQKEAEAAAAAAPPKPVKASLKAGVEIKRARFSSLTKDDVKRAFANLAAVDTNLAKSAEARQVVDLAWGAALTRYLSLVSGSRGDDFLSVGRVQSPVLALIVDREKEIRAFVPTPYWEVHANVRKGQEFPVHHKKGRFETEAEATAVYGRVNAAERGRVAAVEKTERTEQPPDPFNTTSFLRAATALGLGAARAMSVAEDLYTSGWISYPRTDNTVYPEGEDLRAIVKKYADGGGFLAKEAKSLLERPKLTPTKGKKTATDHPPIHPVELPKATDLSGEQWKVYELVSRRFFATLSDPATEERIRATIDIAGEPFGANGHRMLKPGFRAVYHYSKGEDVLLPPLAEGDSVDVVGATLDAKMTTPPKRWSQGKLIQEMENLNLGTKSTRAEIIDKLYRRDYVRNPTPEPTEVGFAVCAALEKHAEVIAKPDMTARLESEMDEVADGKREFATVVGDSQDLLANALDVLASHRQEIADEIRDAVQAKNTLGTCAKSGHPLVIRRSRAGKRFVGCAGWPECDVTFPLPQLGKLVSEPDLKCPTCGAPVIKLIQARRRPWTTCLTYGCRGVEEMLAKQYAEKKAAKEAAAATAEAGGEEASEPAAAMVEPDPEDLGESASQD